MLNMNNCKYLIIGTIVVLVCVVLFSNNNGKLPCINCDNEDGNMHMEEQQQSVQETEEDETNVENTDESAKETAKKEEIEGFTGNDYASI